MPTIIGELMRDEDAEGSSRVTQVIYQSKKSEIKALQDAFEGSWIAATP